MEIHLKHVMSEIIRLGKHVFRKQVADELKTCFPENYVKTDLFGRIIMHEDSRIFASITVRGGKVKIRAGRRLSDYLIFLIGLGCPIPIPLEAMDTIRIGKQAAELKYSTWLKEKYMT